MPSIDVHQHLWPQAVVAALRERRQPPRLDGNALVLAEGSFPFDLHEHDPEERVRLLDRDGIDVAVFSLQPTLGLEGAPELVDTYHEGVRELVAASGGRFRAFAAGACLDGFAGACVPAPDVVVGLGALPAELEQARQVLFVHPGPSAPPPSGAPAWWTAVVDYTAQMQAAYAAWFADGAQRHPRLPVVFAILAGGAPFQLERLRSRGGDVRAALRARMYLDVASYGRRALELCLATYGVGHLLYGSDAPVADPRATLRALRDLGDAVSTTILSENPTSIFT